MNDKKLDATERELLVSRTEFAMHVITVLHQGRVSKCADRSRAAAVAAYGIAGAICQPEDITEHELAIVRAVLKLYIQGVFTTSSNLPPEEVPF